jgi:hypothetical protein
MAEVSGNTAFEDARRALELAIFRRTNRVITMSEWTGKSPQDLGNGSAAWTQMLRNSEAILVQKEYKMPVDQVSTTEATGLLSKNLLSSVRFLSDRIVKRRQNRRAPITTVQGVVT